MQKSELNYTKSAKRVSRERASATRQTTRQFPGYWFSPRWPDTWFPDAFVGTMAQLLCAVEQDTDPEISGRDNLDTLALCEAVLLSAREHRAVTLEEVRQSAT